MIGGAEIIGPDGRLSDRLVAEVKARTALADLVGRVVALHRRGRVLWGLCPFHKEKTPSFKVDEDRGFYHCFGCGAHGGAIDFVMDSENMGFRDAVTALAIAAGLIAEAPGKALRPRKPVVARVGDAETDRERLRTIDWARRLWKAGRPAGGTIVETYLVSRGIRLAAMPPSLRFAAALRHRESGCDRPAMLAAVQAVDGRVVGIHRTFLCPDGGGKIDGPGAKKMGGQCWGGAVRFGPASPVLRIAEGIETALSVLLATGGAPVWAALSLGNLAAVRLPDVVREVRIFADSDEADREAAGRALDRAATRHARDGRTVRIVAAPEGRDWNDVLWEGAK